MVPTVPNILPVPGLPEFGYNPRAGRYTSLSSGRFVKAERIRSALDDFIDGRLDLVEDLSRQLVSGSLPLASWQTQMAGIIKEVNLAGASLQRGGWYNMSQGDFGRAGQKIRGEYDYLRTFVNDIVSGDQPIDGRLVNRARLYVEQGRVTYYDFAAVYALENGYDEERSILTPSESCDECKGEAAKGWVPIGTLQPIGDRICLSNCRCFMQYRNSLTGDVITA